MNGVGILVNVFLDSLERVHSVGVFFQDEASADLVLLGAHVFGQL
jgi:hypothetical protein